MIENKTIVLTGASSGIGLEFLKLLDEGKGNRILAVSRNATKKISADEFKSDVTVFDADTSTKEGVDSIFAKAEELFGKIDIYYNNAGYPYYEIYDYEDWGRLSRIFEANTIGPCYAYVKYKHHLNGREGHLAYTVSAIGTMAMPGYALYSASKFGLQGFQEGIRLEMPKNMKLTCLYPVATDTNFFKTAADGVKFKKPFPVQNPVIVAKKMYKGMEKGKEKVSPSFLFGLSKVIMTVFPPARTIYWNMEKKKLDDFIVKMKGLGKY
ncbi:MAG: SDR family NAD(P)-dependent oxidoreductase [Oscillospiraceae bacterium]|nr:SDR family NAD(P)-dependent oxidoreductase [Oscillospiraceae bacterium]